MKKNIKKVWKNVKNGRISVNELEKMFLESASLMKEMVSVIKEEIASDKECYGKSVDGMKKAIESLENIAKSSASEKVIETVSVKIYEIAMELAKLENNKQENSHDFKRWCLIGGFGLLLFALRKSQIALRCPLDQRMQIEE